MSAPTRILIADDDPTVLTALRLFLNAEKMQVGQASSPQEVTYLLGKEEFDIVLMDLNYQMDTTSGTEGLSLIEQIRKSDEQIPIVVMTGWASIDIAVSAMQAGANDFVQKPWDNQRLLSILHTQLKLARSMRQQNRLSEENQLLKQQIHGRNDAEFIAVSPAMQQLMQQVNAVAGSAANILITGENGCGKSQLANQIHQRSPRAEHPFVSVNMGSIPETLFESEMFGHVRGAFTDAKQTRIGRFELAQQGTLFLDEVGNIPVSQQAKLLRVLEERQFEKVGSSKTQSADVRIMTATNANLQALAEQGEFRMDLLFRLNTVVLAIPPLRERQQDILLLAEQAIARHAKAYGKSEAALSPRARDALLAYHWPGNVRELNHVMERAVLFGQGQSIQANQLQLADAPGQPAQAPPSQPNNADQTLEEIEKHIITDRLAQFDGNAQRTAESLGLSRSAFYRRLDKYQL